MFGSIISDIRFAARGLRANPVFAVVAIASLAIGIGFSTTLFTIVDALLFKPLPVSHAEQLVDVFTRSPSFHQPFGTTSYPDYLDLRSQNDVFDDLVGYTPMFGALSTDTGARLAMGEIVTGNYFKVFGVRASIGRTLTPDDDQPGAPAVAVVSHAFWVRELASAPDAIGRTLRLKGNPIVVVGVLPREFVGMVPILAPELWVPVSASLDAEPLGLHDVVPSPTGKNRLERRGDRWMFMRGRLKPGVTVEQAGANLELIMSRLAESYPPTNKDRDIAVRRTSDVHFHPAADPQVLPIAYALIAVVALVLLVACLNVAGMLVARSSARQREIGIRLAIGAGRGRLLQQLLTESLVLAGCGAVAGLLLARWMSQITSALRLPVPFPLFVDLRIDLRVFTFTLATTVVAAVAAGLIPALQASRPNLTAELRGEHTMVQSGRMRWSLRDVFVAAQVAVATFLLFAAALLTRNLIATERTNLGIPVDRIALVSIDASQLRYSPDRTQQFYDQVLDRIRGLAGVEGVALSTRPPFSLNSNRWTIWIPGLNAPGETGPTVEVTNVSPGYFAAMDVPIVAGRAFTADDRPDTPRVAIVNETMARRFWPTQNAVGQTFRSRGGDGPVFQIVGIAADHKVATVGEPPTPFLHIARNQQANPYSVVIARTRGDSSALLRDMRREIHAIEPTLAFIENQTMEAEVGATLFPVRASTWLVSVVGAVAMLLAAVGLYGVIAQWVAQRTSEIGIRMALGAKPSRVVGLVMAHGFIVATVGILSGCAFAAVLAVLTASHIAGALYGVGASDPASWLAAAVTALSVSAFANLVPAWRAAHVQPSEALRRQ